MLIKIQNREKMLLKGKNAIITGCNKGIGKAIMKVFAENGANIIACVRKKDDKFLEQIKEISNKNSVSIEPIYFDLSNNEEIKQGISEIRAKKIPIDILVNNAGAIFTALFQMTSIEKIKEIFEINYYSQIFFTQNIAKIMQRNRKGNIINISSSAAIDCNRGRLAYASSKAALLCSSKVMAKELSAFNIRVNVIAPGLTQTEMMTSSTPEEDLKDTLKNICLKRVGEPEEIANAVLFLASDLSSYITDQVIRVDGGMR